MGYYRFYLFWLDGVVEFELVIVLCGVLVDGG